MFERWIQGLATDDARNEAPAATRERLKGRFPPGATRRMTTLGMLVGRTLAQLDPGEDDPIHYASGFAESCALEAFLDTFPTPSPTLFQTSIQPSAVQQLMIGRQRAVRELMPISGGAWLAYHAIRSAFLSPASRVLLCGGEERGTWLLEHGLASDRTFGFAAALSRERGTGPLGCARLITGRENGVLGIAGLFDLLHARTNFQGPIAPGWELELRWE